MLNEYEIDFETYIRIIEGEYIKAKLNQAITMRDNYKVTDIPIYVVDNKYVFGPKINGSYEETIKALTQHIEKELKERD